MTALFWWAVGVDPMKRPLVLRHPDGYWQFPTTRTKPLDQGWRWAAAIFLTVLLVAAIARAVTA